MSTNWGPFDRVARNFREHRLHNAVDGWDLFGSKAVGGHSKCVCFFSFSRACFKFRTCTVSHSFVRNNKNHSRRSHPRQSEEYHVAFAPVAWLKRQEQAGVDVALFPIDLVTPDELETPFECPIYPKTDGRGSHTTFGGFIGEN